MRRKPTTSDPQTKMERLESWYRRHFWLVLPVALVLLLIFRTVLDLSYHPLPLCAVAHQPSVVLTYPYLFVVLVDPVFVSAVLVALIGLRLAVVLKEKMRHTLSRLINGGALELTEDQHEQLERTLERRARVYGRRASVVFVISYVALYLFLANVLTLPVPRSTRFWLVSPSGFLPGEVLVTSIPSIVLGSLIGYYAGRVVAYGQLGRVLSQQTIALTAQAGHLDGAAGLKPVGDLYFFQAMLVAFAATFCAVWVILLSLTPLRSDHFIRIPAPYPCGTFSTDSTNGAVLPVYVALLAGTVLIEILAFLVPLQGFHRLMRDQKTVYVDDDTLSKRIANGKKQLTEAQTSENFHALQERLLAMTDYYQAIKQMPTWPVDLRTRQLFTLNNLLLVLPPIASIVGKIVIGP